MTPVWGQGHAGCNSRLIPDLSLGLAWLSFLSLSGLLGLPWVKGLVISSRLISQPEKLRQGRCEEEHGEEGPDPLPQPVPKLDCDLQAGLFTPTVTTPLMSNPQANPGPG